MLETLKEIKKDIIEAFEGNGMKASESKVEDNHKAVPIPQRLKKNKRIAIITGDKAEDVEFFYPYYRFQEEGYEVDVITIDGGSFECKHGLGLKDSKTIEDVNPDFYELLYLPGGKAPEKLSDNKDVLKFVRDFAARGKTIAAICHGPQVLAAAGLLKGKKIAAWPGIKDEIEKAGATFCDEALKEDGQFITARKPGDLHRHLSGIFDVLQDERKRD